MGKKRAMADGENRGETRFFVGGFFYRSGGNLPILGESCCEAVSVKAHSPPKVYLKGQCSSLTDVPVTGRHVLARDCFMQ